MSTNKETVTRIGEREAEWMVDHLPSLRSAAFLDVYYDDEYGDESKQITKATYELYRRRPKLRRGLNAGREWFEPLTKFPHMLESI